MTPPHKTKVKLYDNFVLTHNIPPLQVTIEQTEKVLNGMLPLGILHPLSLSEVE